MFSLLKLISINVVKKLQFWVASHFGFDDETVPGYYLPFYFFNEFEPNNC